MIELVHITLQTDYTKKQCRCPVWRFTFLGEVKLLFTPLPALLEWGQQIWLVFLFPPLPIHTFSTSLCFPLCYELFCFHKFHRCDSTDCKTATRNALLPERVHRNAPSLCEVMTGAKCICHGEAEEKQQNLEEKICQTFCKLWKCSLELIWSCRLEDCGDMSREHLIKFLGVRCICRPSILHPLI